MTALPMYQPTTGILRTDKKILVIAQPCVLGYFNAGHHLSLYEVAAFLRDKGAEVSTIDASAFTHTWKDIPMLLRKNTFDVIAILNDFDIVEGFGRFVSYVREFSPQSKIVTFGRLSAQMAGYYQQYDIDAIVASGDYEAGVAQFIAYLDGHDRPAGVIIREGNNWIYPLHSGLALPVSDWVLPDVTEIPYSTYGELYSNDLRKFCGIPERMELVIPVARGCPVRCNFCEVWRREGLKERRLSVQTVVDYIKQSFTTLPFEYISYYAPTFTLKKQWVYDLCTALKTEGIDYKWKCTTTTFHLDKDLINTMGQAGCIRISVGVETFEQAALDMLPHHKQEARKQFDALLSWCQQANIELNCFIVVGLPGTTLEGTRETFAYLDKHGLRIRPSIYSNYSLLHPDMTESEAVSILARHILSDGNGFTKEERFALYDLAFGLNRSTRVMDFIPKRS